MHSKHLWRAMLILLVGGVGFVVARQFVIPKTFGMTGHYRHESLEDYRGLPQRHQGPDSCRKCHKEDKYKAASQGKHAAVSCEVCHGPGALHTDGEKRIADARKTPLGDAVSYKTCMLCHQQLPSRPKSQPQITIKEHFEKQEVPLKDKIPDKVCFKCHDPHSPKPSE